MTEGVKHILQSCLLAGTVQTVVITSRDFDNLYGGNITLQYVVKFMSFFCFIKTITHFSEIGGFCQNLAKRFKICYIFGKDYKA